MDMLRSEGRYRSSPLASSSSALDPRAMAIRDMDIALQHARHGIDGLGPDYFSSENTRYGGGPSSAPPVAAYETTALSPSRLEDTIRYSRETPRGSELDELVRRTNLAVSLANQNIHPKSHFAQMHPMMCSDGKPPADFRCPKTLESVKLLDSMSSSPSPLYVFCLAAVAYNIRHMRVWQS